MLIKKSRMVLLLVSFLMAVSVATKAEVKYSNFDEDLAKANSLANPNTVAKTVSSGNASNQIAEFNSEKLLRCWQEGQLISTDRGWRPQDKQGIEATFKNGSQGMYLYDFGETFCIYTGE
jgi:hypothetical protein